MDLDKLKEPFPAEDIEWRIGMKTKDGKRARVLAYITARAVMDRLDEVVGVENWETSYETVNIGNEDGVECSLSVRVHRKEKQGQETIDILKWVSKADVAPLTSFEALKGGYSDALKRAGVQWGIGRYLYRLDCPVVRLNERGYFDKKDIPKLPAWALPKKGKK